MSAQPPTPVVHAFLACREIFQDTNTKDFILVGPGMEFAAHAFPCMARTHTFMQMTGLHGRYHFTLQLRDLDDHMVWGENWPNPFDMQDPLTICRLAFHRVGIYIPRPAKYEMVLLANETEIARTPLWAKIRQPPPAPVPDIPSS